MKKRILFLAILFISLIVMPVFAEEPEIGTENPITPEITEKLDINDEQVVISAVEDETYTGSAIEPKVTILYNETELIENTDYTLEYKDNINSGTATIKIVGQGNYTGTKELSFQINSRNVTTLKYSNINNYIYSGKAITPKPTITHNGVRMVNGKDYTLEYKNNTNVGIATVTVVGKGNYTGRKQITFKILKRSITTASISSIGTKIYTGSLIKPSLRIKYNNISLAKGKSYKVTYKNNKNIGVATVTITGIGNYKGTKKITFRIIPRKTTISSALLNGKQITLKWSKVKTADGYKIYMAKGNNSYSLYKTIKGNRTLKYKTGILSRGVTYHFYIKSYKVSKGKTYYSNKSNEKTLRVPTLAELNAKKMAKEYLNVMAFSRLRLIEQLEYEGFTHSQAVYGTDHSGANWYTQAVRCAKEYLNVMSFSREGLIEQLEYEKFTHDQAVYAANKVGL